MRHCICHIGKICILVILPFCFLSAQAERYSEEEIKQQNIFIEATKEKLKGKIDKSKELYLSVYKNNRDNHAAAYEIARVSEALEDREDTEKYIKIAISLDPSNEWYRRYYAQFLELNDRQDEAINGYQELVRIYPDRQEFYEKLSTLYTENDRCDEAVKLYEALENRKGIQENITWKKVNCLDLLGKEKKAIAALEDLVDSQPSNTRYLNALATYLNKAGKTKQSQKLFSKVLQLDPDNEIANIALTYDTAENAETDTYLKSIGPIIRNPQIHIDKKIIELIPYIESMDTDSSIHTSMLLLIEDLKNTHPGEAKSYAIYGDVLMKAGRLEKAITNYQKTLELNHTVFTVWEQLMYAQAEVGDFEGLKETAEQSLDYYPNQPVCYYFNALALFQLKEYDEAADLIDESSYLVKNNAAVLYKIKVLAAHNFLANGKSFKALDQAMEAEGLMEVDDPYLFELIGDIFSEQAKNVEALFMRNQKPEDKNSKANQYYKKAIAAGGNEERLLQKIRKPISIEE